MIWHISVFIVTSHTSQDELVYMPTRSDCIQYRPADTCIYRQLLIYHAIESIGCIRRMYYVLVSVKFLSV